MALLASLGFSLISLYLLVSLFYQEDYRQDEDKFLPPGLGPLILLQALGFWPLILGISLFIFFTF